MGDNANDDRREERATLLCRCEEIADEEIVAAIAAGAVTVNDVKRRTRAGMGSCQGIFCIPAIAALVARATGTGIENVAPMTARPPVRPVPLEALANLAEEPGQQPRRAKGLEEG